MKEMIARVGDRTNKDGIESVCLTTKEIVRCKDCLRRGTYGCPVHVGYGDNDGTDEPDEWFCADGERRTD